MDQIREWAGRPSRVTTRLGSDDAAELASHDLAEIGCHSHTHPVLSALPPEAQDAEIRCNAAALTQITGRPPNAFSYPFGRPGDYGRPARRALLKSGFDIACCNQPAAVTRWHDRLELPRIYVHDVDASGLERALSRWT